jgi:hypothetical protein
MALGEIKYVQGGVRSLPKRELGRPSLSTLSESTLRNWVAPAPLASRGIGLAHPSSC